MSNTLMHAFITYTIYDEADYKNIVKTAHEKITSQSLTMVGSVTVGCYSIKQPEGPPCVCMLYDL